MEYWLDPPDDSELASRLVEFWKDCGSNIEWEHQRGPKSKPEEQDAVEFLHVLIQKGLISNPAIASQNPEEPRRLEKMFRTVLDTSQTCSECASRCPSRRELIVIPAVPPDGVGGSIEEGIARYLENAGETKRCQACDYPVPPARRARITSPPEILIVQIDRTKVVDTDTDKKRPKDFTDITFNEELDLTRHYTTALDNPEEQLQYGLNSVTVHRGQSITAGHYVSYIKRPSGMWVKINNEVVTEIPSLDFSACCSFKDKKTDVPYILVYSRLSVNQGPSSEGAVSELPKGDFAIEEIKIGPSEAANINPLSSLPPDQGQTGDDQQQELKSKPEDDKPPSIPSTDSLFNEKSSEVSFIPKTPSHEFRWEGQPAEIVVQFTLGDMVLKGVLQGVLKRMPKRPPPSEETGSASPGSKRRRLSGNEAGVAPSTGDEGSIADSKT
ncbi:hypothetical protein FQN50_007893 [Emmonsiellopsis sp. PD_5]|nr:hypothetical protein FQN50_007893 [Emmonsiellopsis sp. PD_5]